MRNEEQYQALRTEGTLASQATSAAPLGGPLSRRDLLRSMAVGSAALVAGGAILSACGSSGGKVDVTLQLTGDGTRGSNGVGVAATADDQAKDPNNKAIYAAVLQDWLKQNPGVKLQKIQAPKDTPALRAAIANRTAPAIYGDPGGRSAWVQGFAAETTNLYKKYKTQSYLTNYGLTGWMTQQVGGKWYGVPDYFSSGWGLYYRRDIFEQKGIQPLQKGYTINDLRATAKQLTSGDTKGLAMEYYGLGWTLNANYFQHFAEQPYPGNASHYKYNYLYRYDEEYKAIIDTYRAMMFTDQSIFSDISDDVTNVSQQFAAGKAAMMINIEGFAYLPPGVPFSPQNIAKTTNKNWTDVLGYLPMPWGNKGSFGEAGAYTAGNYFAPYLSATALDKAYSLDQYMIFGDGWTKQLQQVWDKTHDASQIFTYAVAPFKSWVQPEGIPATPATVLGQTWVDEVNAVVGVPSLPGNAYGFKDSTYYPTETTPAPSTDPWKDALTAMAFQQGADVRSVLQQATDKSNGLAQQYQSSISAADFKKAAQQYYSGVDAFWSKQSSAQQFYQEDYHPWYEQVVVPALG